MLFGFATWRDGTVRWVCVESKINERSSSSSKNESKRCVLLVNMFCLCLVRVFVCEREKEAKISPSDLQLMWWRERELQYVGVLARNMVDEVTLINCQVNLPSSLGESKAKEWWHSACDTISLSKFTKIICMQPTWYGTVSPCLKEHPVLKTSSHSHNPIPVQFPRVCSAVSDLRRLFNPRIRRKVCVSKWNIRDISSLRAFQNVPLKHNARNVQILWRFTISLPSEYHSHVISAKWYFLNDCIAGRAACFTIERV